MFKDLTLQQFSALDYYRNMVVTSGPGAGKTRILSHRFCFIILTDDSVSLPQILSLTFTEKAAEEMKDRIYGMLERLDRKLQKGRKGEEVIRERIRETREQFHKNHISTIHSFCANLLREHPVESGIDPGFVVIQGARQRKIMGQAIDAGLSSILKDNKDELMPLLQSFGRRSTLFSAIRSVIDHPLTFNRVINTKERLFRTKEWQGQVFREYCRLIKDNYLVPYLNGLKRVKNGKGQHEQVLSLLENWNRDTGQHPADFGLPDLFRKLRDVIKERRPKSPRVSIREGLREISYLDFSADFYPDLFSLSSPDYIFEKQLNLFLRVAGRCIEHYQAEKQKINALDFADLEALSHSFLTDLFESKDRHGLKRIQKRFKYILVDEFQDTNRIQWEIISILCSDKDRDGNQVLSPGKLFVVGDKRQAIYKFRGGDVTVFEYVTEKIRRSNSGKPVQMFWQNPEINRRIETIEEGYQELLKRQTDAFDVLSHSEREKILMGDIYLPDNFRTDRRPIKFLNNTFEQIFSNKGAERLKEYEAAPRPITMPHGNHCPAEKDGSVTIYLNRGSLRGKDQAFEEASLIVDIIEGILGKHGKENFEYLKYGDIREKIEKNRLAIGILFFAFTHLKTFETMFREACLPFKIHRGKGFYRCQEVMEMIQLLNYLSDERERISLLSALRSSMFALTDPEVFNLFYEKNPTLDQFLSSDNSHVRSVGRQIQSWRLLSGRLTLSELIRVIIADQNLTAIHSVHPDGMQRLANMEKLIDIARRFQAEGNGSLPEFVKYSLEMAEEEEVEGEALLVSEGENPICLMTIHGAKGLEFPMVIIPDLGRRLPFRTEVGKSIRLYSSRKGRPGDWNFEEGEVPVWPVEVPELNFTKVYSPLGYLLIRRNRLEEMAENRRLFYVGCTRTRNHLILIGRMQKRLLEKDRASLTTEDYRERATIMDLLDDIYQFSINFSQEKSDIFEGNGGMPTVIWREPESRKFRGVLYGEEKLSQNDFGIYDSKIKEFDLTGPIKAPPYYQFSFKSIRIFMQCPIRFYYSVILGLKMDVRNVSGLPVHGPSVQDVDFEDNNDWEYGSKEALFLGNVIHGYLERHRFGNILDENLFKRVYERLSQPDLNKAPLREKAFKQLEAAVNDERLIRIIGGEREYAEMPFLFTLSDGCEFRGTMDRLIKNREEGHWVIFDWKSNDLKDKDPHLVAEENGYNLQLACYRWAVEHILNEKVGELYIYFTDGGHLLKSHWGGDLEKIFNKMLQEVRDYENNRDRWVRDLREMKRDKSNCRFCEYRANLCGGGKE